MIQHSVIGKMKVSIFDRRGKIYIYRCINFVIDIVVGRNRTE